MPVNGSYVEDKKDRIEERHVGEWITACQSPIKVHSFDEAIDLTGLGLYNILLLVTLSLATLGMAVDIFGFSVIVTGATCDLNLTIDQTSIMLTAAFIGPVIVAYPWGYISDNYGRRMCLLISLWTSFVVSTLSAFSTNWVCLAVLKFISTSFSSCIQSATYTLLGESCPSRVRDAYMMVMTTILHFSVAVYVGIAYAVLQLDFEYDMGLMTFTPWRLLTILLSSMLGVAAFGVTFFYESPKFLFNIGEDQKALDVLKGIYKCNGRNLKSYPVKNLYLNEEGNTNLRSLPLLQSLWIQISSLFKPPLLWRSIQLYFLTIVVYGTNNSYFMWFPILTEKFIHGINSAEENQTSGLCNMITTANRNTTNVDHCNPTIDIVVVWSGLAEGIVFVIILLCMAKIAHMKKALVTCVLILSGVCGLAAVLINDNITSFIMFFGQMSNELVIGLIFSYFVDIYPTSYRGMATCLCTMIARTSASIGTVLLGSFLMANCASTFYVSSGLMFAGAVVALMLPSRKLS